MLRAITLGCATVLLLAAASLPALAIQDDRIGQGSVIGGSTAALGAAAFAKAGKSAKASRAALKAPQNAQKQPRKRPAVEVVGSLPHPPGCPWIAFCACGAAWELFGTARRDLWPVSAWRKYPKDIARPNNVVFARYSHISVLKSQVEGTRWKVHNYNGTNHRSTIQIRDIAGLEIRNPHAKQSAELKF